MIDSHRFDLSNDLFCAAREFTELKRQAESARFSLLQLQYETDAAMNNLGTSKCVQLLEANEQLVLATLAAHTDVETIRCALAEMAHVAYTDALTGLPNRILLLDRLAQAIVQARRSGSRLALLVLDINDFKQTNDTLGHAVGDQVLKRTARCLTSSVREMDTISRHGGDEFLILLPEMSQKSDAVAIAHKILTALSITNRVGENALSLTASIGISIYPDDGSTAETLIDHADSAMYQAKHQGRGSFAFYGESAAENATNNELALETKHSDAYHSADQELQCMREANQRLVLATLTAQELQSTAELAQRRQTEFMSKVAHELRNPLTPIRTAAALLGELHDDALLPAVQEIIEKQVIHMTRLVDDLFDVSRVITGKLRLQTRLIDMIEIIDTTTQTFISIIEMRCQHFIVKIPKGPIWIQGDPVRLAQILNNLLDNASKYTPKNGDIELSLKVIDDELMLKISDSGIGIAADALTHIFEPFIQESHAVGFNDAGLGLGLTLVSELVNAHGRRIMVTSEGANRGSEFVVTLPLEGPQDINNRSNFSPP